MCFQIKIIPQSLWGSSLLVPSCPLVLDKKMFRISKFIIRVRRIMAKRDGYTGSTMISNFIKRMDRMLGMKHRIKILVMLIQVIMIINHKLFNKKYLKYNKILN